MNTDITMLDRRSLIQLALDVNTTVASKPLFHIDLTDLPTWMDLLSTDHCMLRLRHDGAVEVDASGMYRGELVIVCTKADMVRGLELPPPPDVPTVDNIRSTPLPAHELWRLESLRSEVAS